MKRRKTKLTEESVNGDKMKQAKLTDFLPDESAIRRLFPLELRTRLVSYSTGGLAISIPMGYLKELAKRVNMNPYQLRDALRGCQIRVRLELMDRAL